MRPLPGVNVSSSSLEMAALNPAVNNGATHMFSNAESANAFQRSSKDHTTSGEMDAAYHSEGFISYAAFCESATQNPGLWDEFTSSSLRKQPRERE